MFLHFANLFSLNANDMSPFTVNAYRDLLKKKTFKDFFDKVIEAIHNFGPNDVQPPMDLDAEKVSSPNVNPFLPSDWAMTCNIEL